MEQKSFVIIMSPRREYVNVNFGLEDFVYQTMLLGDATTPKRTSTSFESFRFASACLGMILQFLDDSINFLVSCGLRAFQPLKIFNRLRRVDNLVHQPTRFRKSSNDSPGSISTPSPHLICSLAFSTWSKNSSLLSRVGSASFSETSLRKYLATRFSMPSSSARAPRLRNISAFNCRAFIKIIFTVYAAKIHRNSKTTSK